ncbi:26983_t:CDS:1, partial [Gigaspora margarita]
RPPEVNIYIDINHSRWTAEINNDEFKDQISERLSNQEKDLDIDLLKMKKLNMF